MPSAREMPQSTAPSPCPSPASGGGDPLRVGCMIVDRYQQGGEKRQNHAIPVQMSRDRMERPVHLQMMLPVCTALSAPLSPSPLAGEGRGEGENPRMPGAREMPQSTAPSPCPSPASGGGDPLRVGCMIVDRYQQGGEKRRNLAIPVQLSRDRMESRFTCK